jgi:hypothetical protein
MKVCFPIHEPTFQDPNDPRHLNKNVVQHCEELSDEIGKRFATLWDSEKESMFLFWKREIASRGQSFESWLEQQWDEKIQRFKVPKTS